MFFFFVSTNETSTSDSEKIIYVPRGKDIFLIAIVGVLHTGIAFSMYISSMSKLQGQSISILSYIDPGSAFIFAFILLIFLFVSVIS